MKITNIGGATAILEHNNKRILFDPWMDEGILYGSWYHWPKLNVKISDLGNFDYIYISHIHEDHCSPGTIKYLNKDAEVIIMHREPAIPNFVKKFLETYNFNFKKIHLVNPFKPTKINDDFIVEMITADPNHKYNYLVDSGIVIDWDGYKLYNANDCAPYEEAIEHIKKSYKNIDLALLPYAGGSGYPGCYNNLSHEEKLNERKRILENRYDEFVKTIKDLDPDLVMPFADQYVIGGKRGFLNKYAAHPVCPGDVNEILEQNNLNQKLLLLNPGQSYNIRNKTKSPNDKYKKFSFEDRENYINELEKKIYDHEKVTFRDSVPIHRMIETARNRLWSYQKRRSLFPDYRLYLRISDRNLCYEIDLKNENIKQIYDNKNIVKPFLKLNVTNTLLTMILINHISWNMADFFIDYEREPNIYNQDVYAMINQLIL